MSLADETACLQRVPFLSSLDAPRLKLLAFASERETFEDGEVLFEEGECAECTYLILSGHVHVIAKSSLGSTIGHRLGRHDLVGELAVLRGAPRSAAVLASGRLEVLRMPAEVFLELLSDDARVALGVMRHLSDKLVRCHEQIEALRSDDHGTAHRAPAVSRPLAAQSSPA